MDLNDLKNFDVSDLQSLGNAPTPIKAIVVALILCLILGAGYYFSISNKLDELTSAENKEEELKHQLERQASKAANIEGYKEQLAEMQTEFGAMLRQLPSGTEIPAVILDVSQTGLASGLKILLFKPQSEINKGFYAEKPIQIQVSGTYHQMANFSSGIAALPRIVTLHDIKLKPGNKENELVMDVTAKTYRYLADEEAETPAKQKKRRG